MILKDLSIYKKNSFFRIINFKVLYYIYKYYIKKKLIYNYNSIMQLIINS